MCLETESPSDLGADDLHVARVDAEHLADRELELVRPLRRGPDPEAGLARAGEDPPTLERGGGNPGVAKIAAHDGRRRVEGGADVSDLELGLEVDVASIVVQTR